MTKYPVKIDDDIKKMSTKELNVLITKSVDRIKQATVMKEVIGDRISRSIDRYYEELEDDER